MSGPFSAVSDEGRKATDSLRRSRWRFILPLPPKSWR